MTGTTNVSSVSTSYTDYSFAAASVATSKSVSVATITATIPVISSVSASDTYYSFAAASVTVPIATIVSATYVPCQYNDNICFLMDMELSMYKSRFNV